MKKIHAVDQPDVRYKISNSPADIVGLVET